MIEPYPAVYQLHSEVNYLMSNRQHFLFLVEIPFAHTETNSQLARRARHPV